MLLFQNHYEFLEKISIKLVENIMIFNETVVFIEVIIELIHFQYYLYSFRNHPVKFEVTGTILTYSN